MEKKFRKQSAILISYARNRNVIDLIIDFRSFQLRKLELGIIFKK